MKKSHQYICLLVLTVSVSSCKKIVEGLNQSPNSPTAAPYALTLNGAETAGILIYEGNLARIAGIFSRSFTGADRQYVSINNYNSSSEDYNDTWDNFYSLVIGQYKIVEAQSEAVNDRRSTGITQVLLAQAFGLATDLWGDIPFKQAGNAALYPKPAFDKQADVYAGIIALLDSAIDNLKSGTGNGPGSKDFYFQSDVSSWEAVAYTLQARYYLHVKDYVNALASAANGIGNASGNMLDPHGSSFGIDLNIYYAFMADDRVGYMNAQGAIAPALLNPADPAYRGNVKTNETARFEYLYQFGIINAGELDPNIVVDFDFGTPTNQNGFFGGSTSFPLVTFEENQLILAEAYLKQGSPDMALALAALNKHREYLATGGSINTGYRPDGLEYDDYVPADFMPGGIDNPVGSGLNQSDALLKEVLQEKYLTLVGQIEQFTDLRRTHNFIGITPVKGSVLPQRFLYPQDEINTNPNTPKLSAGDLLTPTPINTSAY